MNIMWKKFNIGGIEIEAKVTNYEIGDKKKLSDLYKRWKSLSNDLREISTRGINLPEAISENAFCLFFTDCVRVVKLKKGKCSFDAINIKTGSKIQIKASSVDEDLTSFGPCSEWDELFFLDFSRGDGTFDIYKIEPELIYTHQVNANQSFRDQQNDKRRPRFSIKKDIIRTKNLQPLKVCSLN